MKKLRILQSFSKLSVVNPLTAIALPMRNFIAIFAGIPGICKHFAANRDSPFLLRFAERTG